MAKCQAHILREFKTVKADCMWPQTVYGPNGCGTLPVCGGDVTVKVKAVDEPEYGGHYAKLEIEFTCTRCKHPWLPNRIEIEGSLWDGIDITRLFDGG